MFLKLHLLKNNQDLKNWSHESLNSILHNRRKVHKYVPRQLKEQKQNNTIWFCT